MTYPTNKEEKLAITTFLKESSASLTRMEAEKDFLKTSKADFSELSGLDKKILARLVKVYHAGNMEGESAEFNELEELYKAVVGK